jgi:hypothetical protein
LSTIKSNALGATLAIISSIALSFYVAISFIHSATINRAPHDFNDYLHFTAKTSLDITTGHPLWKNFQGRVLAPYAIKALSFGSLDYYEVAYLCFQIVTLAVAAFLCWRLGRKYGGSNQSALFALMLFVMCFAFLLSPPLLYSWDFVDIIIFIVFLDLALSGFSLPWFLGLFAIAIWNRESAYFIALWLILDPLIRFLYQRQYNLQKTPIDSHRIIAGIICVAAGFIIAESLRRNLLVEETGVRVIPDSIPGRSYYISLLRNIEFLTHPMSNPRFWIVIPFLAVVVSLGTKFVRLDPQRNLGIYLVELSILVALFIFGLFDELRDCLIFVPFVVLSGVLVSAAKTSGVGNAQVS